jgi:hypothetical protein
MSDDPTCTHGRVIGGPSQLPPGGWFGGRATCSCCAQRFGYRHSSTYNSEGLVRSSTQDTTLCPPCGGKRTEYLNPNYELVEVRPGFITFRRKGVK